MLGLSVSLVAGVAVVGLCLSEGESARGDSGEMVLSDSGEAPLRSTSCPELSRVWTGAVAEETEPDLASGPDSGMEVLELG